MEGVRSECRHRDEHQSVLRDKKRPQMLGFSCTRIYLCHEYLLIISPKYYGRIEHANLRSGRGHAGEEAIDSVESRYTIEEVYEHCNKPKDLVVLVDEANFDERVYDDYSKNRRYYEFSYRESADSSQW
jgi:hypothetical protein